ncbi:MAG: T9SS type A sorting domain-containing protein [Bacteroidales bacterium]|nr:T9SS type A sorting domain-containing protein [Bacteroidales bacterium]
MKLIGKFLILVLTCLFSVSSKAQDYKLTIWNFDKNVVDKISDAVSIDLFSDTEIVAFANEREFIEFKKLGIPYKVENLKLVKPKSISKSVKTTDDISQMTDFSAYPSYDVYIKMMENFHAKFPDITELIEIGTSVQGRKLLVLKISDSQHEAQNPEFLLTSTMHGDELCGYVLMLRFIDFLLNNKDTDSQVKNILENVVLYINPLSNPDGTYIGGNDDVSSSQRYNANNEDLNRNFPSIVNSQNSVFQYEPEVKAMMDFAENHHFVVSANIHSGDEVVNYPWDSFYDYEKSLADEDWFVEVSKKYVELARIWDPDYMKTVTDEGYVFGSEWYKVKGGRQDYMYWNHRCKEFTLEVSAVKVLDSDNLTEFWQKNYKSLLGLVESCLQGITGKVTDVSGNNLEAEIVIKGIDANHSSVFSSDNGLYFRPLLADKTLEVCAVIDGYETECQTVTTEKDKLVQLDFVLNEGESLPVSTVLEPQFPTLKIQSDVKNKITVTSNREISCVMIVNSLGNIVLSDKPETTNAEYSLDNFSDGIYVIKAKSGNYTQTKKISIIR